MAGQRLTILAEVLSEYRCYFPMRFGSRRPIKCWGIAQGDIAISTLHRPDLIEEGQSRVVLIYTVDWCIGL